MPELVAEESRGDSRNQRKNDHDTGGYVHAREHEHKMEEQAEESSSRESQYVFAAVRDWNRFPYHRTTGTVRVCSHTGLCFDVIPQRSVLHKAERVIDLAHTFAGALLLQAVLRPFVRVPKLGESPVLTLDAKRGPVR